MNPLVTKKTDESVTPVRRAARRMRWFFKAFNEQVKTCEAKTGFSFKVDEDKIREVFLNWVQVFEAQKPSDPEQKANYTTFAAATMLRELIQGRPLSVLRELESSDKEQPAHFWPDGYIYLMFCIDVRAMVFEQEFGIICEPSPRVDDIKTWWSFKENAAQDASTAIGFFELFVGGAPNWSTPGFFSAEHAEQNSLEHYNKDQKTISK
ncbi:MAG: hypothetical protein AB8B94_06100 [Hyphomicrobiales bacterium]